jgi:hypothetical protein
LARHHSTASITATSTCNAHAVPTVQAMNDGKFIQFPGVAKNAQKSVEPTPGFSTPGGLGAPGATDGLNDDQRKALQIVLSGMPFVMIGIKPTNSGADFFTALHGEPTDLRNAAEHLPGVIERAYDRKGI